MFKDSGRQPEKRLPKMEPLATTIKSCWENYQRRVERNGIPEFKTGIDAMDKGCFGLHRNHLTVIAARPGNGKSSLCGQIAYQLAKDNHKVAYVSLEMTKETLLERMFCSEYGIASFDFLTGYCTEEIIKKWSRFCVELERLPLKIFDDYCFSENELYTLIEHLEFRPDVIILDHLQEIRRPNNQRISQWEALTEYLRYFKELAMQHKMIAIVVSQINREGNESPSLVNLKGAGGIEEMSDEVFLLYPKKKEEIKGSENFVIKLAKNRFGPPATFDLYFDGSTHKFYNI